MRCRQPSTRCAPRSTCCGSSGTTASSLTDGGGTRRDSSRRGALRSSTQAAWRSGGAATKVGAGPPSGSSPRLSGAALNTNSRAIQSHCLWMVEDRRAGTFSRAPLSASRCTSSCRVPSHHRCCSQSRFRRIALCTLCIAPINRNDSLLSETERTL